MVDNHIATTSGSDLEPLAYQGIIVFNQYPQIREMIERKFGMEYCQFFAEPAENRNTGEIDWYAQAPGAIKSWSDLTDEERIHASERLQSVGEDIQKYAQELIRSSDPLKITRGNVLELALCFPSNEYIFLCGSQPVLAAWGCISATPGAEPRMLAKLASPLPARVPQGAVKTTLRNADPPASPPPPAHSGGLGWLWWLLPFLLAILLILLFFTSFGEQPSLTGKNFINASALPFLEKNDHGDEIYTLNEEIKRLKDALKAHIALCLPVVKKPEVNGEAPRPEAPLIIPPHADDTAFLEGAWICETGLASNVTKEPVKIIFSFDKQGKGKGIVYEQHDQCTGNSKADMKNGKLHIYVTEQKCANSDRVYAPVNIICESAEDSSTMCHGLHEGGGAWNANFQKLP